MPPRINDPGIRQNQPDQADVHEIVRHFVDEQRGVAAVRLRVAYELVAETFKVTVIEFPEVLRIRGRTARITAAETLRNPQDLMELHGSVDHRMGRKNLFKQCRTCSGKPDDEYRVATLAAQFAAVIEEFARANIHLLLDQCACAVRAVATLGISQLIAPFVVLKRCAVIVSVFKCLSDSKTQMNPVIA